MKRILNNISFIIFCVFVGGNFVGFSQNKTFSGSSFIENKGQIVDQNNHLNKDVLYMYVGKGIKIQLRKGGYSYELFAHNNVPNLKSGKKKCSPITDLLKTTVNNYRIDMDFYEMNSNTKIIASQKKSEYRNYFIEGKEISNVASYNKITYKNVFPNTDIEFILSANETSPFKYNIILHPGADINKVQILCKGASSITTDNSGISITNPMGIINEIIPFSYYANSPTENKKVSFKLNNNLISFSANYDKSKTFIIDPSTNRIWGTYFGDTGLDYCTSTGSDASNNVYIAGYTSSTANIATVGIYQNIFGGTYDAYLAKFNSNGVLQWSTYFGGSGLEVFYALFVLPNGTIYATGDTNSPSGVASIGAHQTAYGGGIDDATLVKFNTNGQLQWATYYGGAFHDISSAITVDNNGDIIFGGHTQSSNTANCIATPSAYMNFYTLTTDVFIAKFNSSGVRQWGTYFGDTGIEEAYGIDCDAANNIYFTGFTESTFNIATGGAHQTVMGGLQDAFMCKFNPAGTNLLLGTYYGGSNLDGGTSIEISNTGDIFVGGNTTSTNNINSPGSYQTALASADDGFLVRFNNLGVRQWGTYFGGNDVDYIFDINLDVNNNILFCGETESTNNISTAGAYQNTITTTLNYDAYFEKFSMAGTRKLGTYFGGDGNDNARGMTIDNAGKVYLAGETTSTVSIASIGAFLNVAPGGGGDAFLAKFCVAPEPLLTPAGIYTMCITNTATITATAGFPTYTWTGGSNLNPLVTSTFSPGTYTFAVTVSDGFGCTGTSDTLKVMVNACTGIAELENNFSINLYPNPANDFIYLDLKNVSQGEIISIEIYSSLGELVFASQTKESFFNADTKKFAAGIYFLRTRVNNKILERKFVRE